MEYFLIVSWPSVKNIYITEHQRLNAAMDI